MVLIEFLAQAQLFEVYSSKFVEGPVSCKKRRGSARGCGTFLLPLPWATEGSSISMVQALLLQRGDFPLPTEPREVETTAPSPVCPTTESRAPTDQHAPLGKALSLRGRVRVVPFQKVSL